jgi:hypothetical protein
LSKRRQSEIAAAGFASPAAIAAGGVAGPAQVEQWFGETESPDSLTVVYGAADISVTTYSLRWSEDVSAMLLEEGEEVVNRWVETCYGSAWWLRQPEAFDLDHLKEAETRLVETRNGYFETSEYGAAAEAEEERRRMAREESARDANHRVVSIPFGDSLVDATVVGDGEMWSAGFEMPPDSIPLSVLVRGGSVPVDTLRLELVDDLLAYLDRTQAESSKPAKPFTPVRFRWAPCTRRPRQPLGPGVIAPDSAARGGARRRGSLRHRPATISSSPSCSTACQAAPKLPASWPFISPGCLSPRKR